MIYEFEPGPAGTYMSHSHQGLQLERGLVGPLIIEERAPHVEYDREHTVILDDFLPGAPRPLGELAAGRGREGGGGMMGGGMMGRDDENGGGMMGGGGCPMMDGEESESGMMGGGMGGIVPPYEGLLVNGKLPGDPAVFDVKEGERVRFRLVNPSSATTYHLALSGHRMWVSHADGLVQRFGSWRLFGVGAMLREHNRGSSSVKGYCLCAPGKNPFSVSSFN